MWRNKANNLATKLKKEHYRNEIKKNKNDGRKLWKTIRNLMPGSISAGPSNLKCGADIIADNSKMANSFNDFFANIGLKLTKSFGNLADHILSAGHENSKVRRFIFKEIDPTFVLDQLNGISVTKATGLDLIPAKLLKCGAPIIYRSLTHLFNMSLRTGKLPDQWKMAKVTPLFKKGSKSDMNNYRPISVLPIATKILERAVHAQLYGYLNENGLICENQSGFRSSHSTKTSLLNVVDYIFSNMDSGKLTGAIYIDLSKAFDTVDHVLLLEKLSKFGVNGLELDWMKNYLADRMQRTNINGHLSEASPVQIGVPQGSILGPLFFLMYVNDLPSVTKLCKVVLYADDTALFYAADDLQQIQNSLLSDFLLVSKWMDTNRLVLNVDKTKSMIFGTHQRLRNRNLFLNSNDINIDVVNQFKYLGVVLDQHLNWESHGNMIAESVSRRLGAIWRIRKFLDQKTCELMVKALVFPLMTYCGVVWMTCSKGMQTKIQRLHSRAAKLVLGRGKFSSSSLALSNLKWHPINHQWNVQLAVMTWKCVNNFAPPYLSTGFQELISSNVS